jgi:hypothetical protein
VVKLTLAAQQKNQIETNAFLIQDLITNFSNAGEAHLNELRE